MRHLARGSQALVLALVWAVLASRAADAAVTPTLYLVDLVVQEVTWVIPAVIAKRYPHGKPEGAAAIPLQFAPARLATDPPGDLERRFVRHYLGDGAQQPESIRMGRFLALLPGVEQPVLDESAETPRMRDAYRVMFPPAGSNARIDYELSLPAGGDERTYFLRPKGMLPGFSEQNFVYAVRDFASARSLFAYDEAASNLTPTTAPVRDVSVIELPGDPWELAPAPGTVNAYVGSGSSTVVFHYPDALDTAPLLAIDTRLFDDEIDASRELITQVEQLAARLDSAQDARGDPLLATVEALADRGATLGPQELRDLAEAARQRERATREGSRLAEVLKQADVLYAAFNRREVRAYRAFVPVAHGDTRLSLRVHTLSEPELARVASNAIDTAAASAWYKVGHDPAYWFEGLTPFGALLAQPGYRGVQTRGDAARYYRVANRDQVRYFQRRIQAWSETVAPPDASAHFGPRDWTPPTGFQPIGLAQVADAGVFYPAELRNTVDGSRFVLVSGSGAPFYIRAFEVGALDWRRYLETIEGKEQIAQGDDAVAKAQEPVGLAKEYAKLTAGQKQAARYFLPENDRFFGLGVTTRGVTSVGKRIRVAEAQRTPPPQKLAIVALAHAQVVSGPTRVNPEPKLPEEYARVFDDLVKIPIGKPARGMLPLDTFDYAAWIGGDADVRLPTDAEWRAALSAAHPGLIDAPLLPAPAAGLTEPLGAEDLAGAARDRSWCGAHGMRGNVPEWTLAAAPAGEGAQVELHLRGFAWDDDGSGAEDPHDALAGDTAETGYWRAGFRLVLVPHLQ